MAGSFFDGRQKATPGRTAAAVPARRSRDPPLRAPDPGATLSFKYLLYRIETVENDRWLARVRHDLVKRLVWPARDRRDLGGGAPAPGELCAHLVDDEGAPTTSHALWSALAAEAPRGAASGDAIVRFEDALARAVSAAAAGDVDGLLALEPSFDALARSLEEESGEER
jgi:hypothetical protein